MNLNEAFIVILDYLIKDSKNKQFIEKLNIIKKGIENKKHVEEQFHPRFQSLVLFGQNMFPFSNNEYLEIAEEIKRNNNEK